MKIIFERLGSPYLSRRVVKVVYGNVIPEKTKTFTVKELILIGAAIQSIRDTSSELKIHYDEDLVVETRKYIVKFGHTDLVCLEPEEQLPPIFNVVKKVIGYTAAIGLVAAVYDNVKAVEKKESRSEVKGDESEVSSAA